MVRTAETRPGFANPVADSQAVFRAVLDAMARPGTLHEVHAPSEPPAPLDRATAAVLLTLADADTPLWLDPAAEAARAWTVFHCGASHSGVAEATIAVALGPVALDSFGAGTDEQPEAGATVVLQVAALGRGRAFVLSGPGLLHPAPLLVDGLPRGFAAAWARNAAQFPRGVDVVLCAGGTLAALPRTAAMREA